MDHRPCNIGACEQYLPFQKLVQALTLKRDLDAFVIFFCNHKFLACFQCMYVFNCIFPGTRNILEMCFFFVIAAKDIFHYIRGAS